MDIPNIRFTIRQLRYFIAVAELGSIALAARKLHISSPSISGAIKGLEEEFGIQLFLRHHAKGLSLTKDGQVLYQAAGDLLRQAAHMKQQALNLSNEEGGQIRLGCLQTIAPLLLGGLRYEFEKLHPDIRVLQSETNHEKLLKLLVQGEIDVCLTYDLEFRAGVDFLPLGELNPYVMLGKSHRLADKASLSLAELADEPMVLLDLPVSARYFLSLFNKQGLSVRVVERSKDIHMVRSLVANGFGYSLSNFPAPHNFAGDGKELVYVPLEDKVRALSLGLAYRDTSGTVAPLRIFIDYCRQNADKLLYR